jgi:hypothetical protein
MLKYLDDEDCNAATHAYQNNEIDINVTNYKIKLSRYLNRNEISGKQEMCICNSFDSNPLNEIRSDSSEKRNRNSYILKPDFKKISQIN